MLPNIWRDHLYIKGTGREMQIPFLTAYTEPSHLQGIFPPSSLYIYHLLIFTVSFSKMRREQDLDSGTETLIHIHPHTPKIKAIAQVPLFKIYF